MAGGGVTSVVAGGVTSAGGGAGTVSVVVVTTAGSVGVTAGSSARAGRAATSITAAAIAATANGERRDGRGPGKAHFTEISAATVGIWRHVYTFRRRRAQFPAHHFTGRSQRDGGIVTEVANFQRILHESSDRGQRGATMTRLTSRTDLHCHSTASQVSKLGVARALGLPECHAAG
jgi:hypothetical protein